MTSYEIRNNPLFLRNAYFSDNIWDIPCIEKQDLSLQHVSLIAYSATKARDSAEHYQKGGALLSRRLPIPPRVHTPCGIAGQNREICLCTDARLVHLYQHATLAHNGKRGSQPLVRGLLAE